LNTTKYIYFTRFCSRTNTAFCPRNMPPKPVQAGQSLL